MRVASSVEVNSRNTFPGAIHGSVLLAMLLAYPIAAVGERPVVAVICPST
jgi:hypothetical protein